MAILYFIIRLFDILSSRYFVFYRNAIISLSYFIASGFLVLSVEDFVFGGDLGGDACAGADVTGANLHAFGLVETDAGGCGADTYIVKADVANRFRLCALQHEGAGGCLVACQPVDMQVGYSGIVAAGETLAGILAGNIEEVLHVAENAVFDINTAHESAAVGIGLDIESAFAVAGIVAVLDDDIAHSTRHLASDYHGVQSLEMAVADYDVLAGHSR